MNEAKSVHVRLSHAGTEALKEYALRRGLTRANAAAQLINEHIFGRDRVPDVVAPDHKPDVDAGHIYIIRAGEYFKIGKAKNTKRRLAHLQLPFENEIVASFPVANRHHVERELHKQFADKRANGEWFRLTVDDLSGISRDLGGAAGSGRK